MDDEVIELDGLTASLIADDLICPFVPDCRFYRIANQPDHNALYYATHFCGNRYRHCQVYGTRSSELDTASKQSCTDSRSAEETPKEHMS